MSDYESDARGALLTWQREMLRDPGLLSRSTRQVQAKLNSYIPERVHGAVTMAVKQMTRAVLAGSHYTTQPPLQAGTLSEREALVRNKIEIYRRTAAAEGGVTGAGGVLLGLADFPLLIGIKIKLLFEIAALYGYATSEYHERVYLLHVFQLAFSSDEHRREIYLRMANWSAQRAGLPASFDDFDWRTFQQEYRDYIDVAKIAQLLPIVGAPVGFVANYLLVHRLGRAAVNAYRMRWFEAQAPRRLPKE